MARVGPAMRAAGGLRVNRGRPGAWPSSVSSHGRFAYTAFVTDVYARRIVGWACATGMGTREPPLQALERAISRASRHGGTQGLVRHGDHGARYIGTVCTTRVPEYGMLPSTGTVGDSYDNAMAESVNGAYQTGLVWRSKPFRTPGELELATFQWVSWWNTKRLHASLDYKTPQQVETEYYEHQRHKPPHCKDGTKPGQFTRPLRTLMQHDCDTSSGMAIIRRSET